MHRCYRGEGFLFSYAEREEHVDFGGGAETCDGFWFLTD